MEFGSRARISLPATSNHCLYPVESFIGSQLFLGIFRRKPATRCFDESFAPRPRYATDLHVRNAYEPPPKFPLASPNPGLGQYLSGPSITTPTPFRRGSECVQRITFVSWFLLIQVPLAVTLDSSVRVSRRVVGTLSTLREALHSSEHLVPLATSTLQGCYTKQCRVSSVYLVLSIEELYSPWV